MKSSSQLTVYLRVLKALDILFGMVFGFILLLTVMSRFYLSYYAGTNDRVAMAVGFIAAVLVIIQSASLLWLYTQPIPKWVRVTTILGVILAAFLWVYWQMAALMALGIIVNVAALGLWLYERREQ